MFHLVFAQILKQKEIHDKKKGHKIYSHVQIMETTTIKRCLYALKIITKNRRTKKLTVLL